MSEETKEPKFETVKIEASRIVDAFAGKDNEIYYRILVSENTSFIRAAKQVKPVKDEPGMRCFSLPEDFTVHLTETAKNHTTGKYVDVECDVTVTDLKDLIAEKEVQGFVNFVVPKKYVSEKHISNEGNAYNFVFFPGIGSTIRSSESLKPVEGKDDVVRFSLPAEHTLTFSKKNEDEKSLKTELTPIDVKVQIAKMAIKKAKEAALAEAEPKKGAKSR